MFLFVVAMGLGTMGVVMFVECRFFDHCDRLLYNWIVERFGAFR